MPSNEPTMIGVSERAHSILTQLKDDGHVGEMADGFRLGIALALSLGIDPPEVANKRTTYSVATIDPQQQVATAIRALVQLGDGSVYRMAERLADWGILELHSRFHSGSIEIGSLLPRVSSADR